MADQDAPSQPKYIVFLAYLFLFCYYVRIQDNIPGLNAIPWVGALFLIFTLWGLTKTRQAHFLLPLSLIFWLGLLFACTGIGAISTISYKMAFKWVFQTFPQCVALFVIFTSSSRFKSLLNFWCVLYFFMAVFTIKNAPLGPGDFTRDPNDACLALCMGFPFVFYAMFQKELSKKAKYFYGFTAVLILIAIVMTSSRGGFLGLIAVMLTMWWLSSNRLKTALLGGLLACSIGLVVLFNLPEGYLEDMQSISDTEDSTRIERLRTWEIGWLMFKDKPLVGAGAGNFSNTSHLYQYETSWWTGEQRSLSGRQSHSLYFEILPELGIFGVLIYGYIMFVLPMKLYSRRKQLKGDGEYDDLIGIFSRALIAAMAGYAIAGAFISVAYYPHIPIWLTFYSILQHYSKVESVAIKP